MGSGAATPQSVFPYEKPAVSSITSKALVIACSSPITRSAQGNWPQVPANSRPAIFVCPYSCYTVTGHYDESDTSQTPFGPCTPTDCRTGVQHEAYPGCCASHHADFDGSSGWGAK